MFDLPKRLTYIRESKGYSVYKLAQISDVSATYIQDIERGKKQPSVEIMGKLCAALGLTLSDFFTTEEAEFEPELLELINNARKLSKEQISAFNEVFKTIV